MPGVALTPEVGQLLERNAVVAVGVSGGKDSVACAIAVDAHLKKIGHTGPKVLIHSDLGRVEWKESLPVCERLAAHLGWELMTVRRRAGDMMARWEGRWAANVLRYETMECVKLILPWSTPALRFCTGELKRDVITAALKKRFPGAAILNVTGIRREESANRKKAAVSAPEPKLITKKNYGVTWNAIIEWSISQVFASIASRGLALHEAYTKYGVSRVSCVYCIMSSQADLLASTGCADNHDILRQMVELEAASTFAFQGSHWLADTAPYLLGGELRERIERAKLGALARQSAEARIPKHLLYTKGWPTVLPTYSEAEMLAEVRADVARAVGLNVSFTSAESVRLRYEELLHEQQTKQNGASATPELDGDDSFDMCPNMLAAKACHD